MKKFFLSVIASLLFMANSYSQTPQSVNYQAVVRDASGNPVASGTSVSVRFTIHDGGIQGTVVFSEVQHPVTNQFGLISLQMGTFSNLSNVPWGTGQKYLQVEIDPAGGSNYTDMGTSQLMSVPYALFAANSANGPPGSTGPAGPQGDAGVAGPTGPQGIAGAQGAAGPQGATGSQGAVGPTGPQGQQGVAGPQGQAGPAGPQGNPGVAGPAGVQGAAGPAGAQGQQGAQGIQGITGATGTQGLQGVTGTTGSQGIAGTAGAQGPAGPQGLIGNTGPQGATGVQGATGLQGANGDVGATGPMGATGAQGIQGPTGNNGIQGATGADGMQGPTGADGVPGPTGNDGLQGPTGNDGAIGATGPTGNDGVQGSAGATGATGITGSTGVDGSNCLSLQYYTALGHGCFQFDNDSFSKATIFYMHKLFTDGTDLLPWIQGIAPGSTLQITNLTNPGNFGIFTTTGSYSDQGYYVSIGIQFVTGTGAMTWFTDEGAVCYTINGVAGAQGPTGPSGQDGAVGATGPSGVDGAQGPTGPTGANGSNCINWQYGNGTDAGTYFYNNLNFPALNDLQLSSTSANGADVTSWLGTIATGSTIQITNQSDYSNFGIYTVTSITNLTDHFELGLQFISGQGELIAGNAVNSVCYTLNGVAGATGPSGQDGAQGPTGANGNDGAVGATGPAGQDGAVGATGPSGQDGAQGPTGANGNDGAVGPTGPTGQDGAQGPIGVAGNDGAVGATGPSGQDGAAGVTGPSGQDGTAGATGPTGAAGTNGSNCITWNWGDEGSSGQFAMNAGTYPGVTLIFINTTAANGVDVTSWLNSITSGSTFQATNLIDYTQFGIFTVTSNTAEAGFNMIGVSSISGNGAFALSNLNPNSFCYTINGAAGATGATGPSGSNGLAGATGATGNSGVDGATGAVGATGANGDDGVTGPTGNDGAQGATGATGANGTNGSAGVTGATGPSGQNGTAGAIGATGPSGQGGAVGPTGANGSTGSIGATGPSGQDGTAGATGATGATGAAGANGANCLTWNFGDEGTSGQFAINGPFYSALSVLFVNNTAANGGSASTWLNAITPGSTLQVTNMDDNTQFGIYTVTSNTAVLSFHDIGVSFITGNGFPSTSSSFCFTLNGAAGATGPSGSNGSAGATGATGPTGVGVNGTANYVTKFITTDSIGNSLIYDDGTNVGIGTTIPAAPFEVDGAPGHTSLLVYSNTVVMGDINDNGNHIQMDVEDNNGRVQMGDINDASHGIQVYVSDQQQYIQLGDVDGFKGNATSILVDDLNRKITMPQGNVGIGTATPNAKLEVDTSFRYVDGNQQAGYVLTSDSFGDAKWQPAPTGGGSADSGGYWTLNSGNLYNNVGTNVGIGTNNPAQALDVNGSIHADSLIDGSGLVSSDIGGRTLYDFNGNANIGWAFPGILTLNNPTVNTIIYNNGGLGVPTFNNISAGSKLVIWQQDNLSKVDYAIGMASGTMWQSIPQANVNYWYSYFAGTTEIMRLTGAGNLGINNTNPTVALDVVGSSRIHDGTAQPGYVLTASDTFGTASWQAPAGGLSVWDTLGGNIYNGNTGGNVGIGTSTPAATLEVNGYARIDNGLSATGASVGVYAINGDAGSVITQYLSGANSSNGEGAGIWGNAAGDPGFFGAINANDIGVVGQSYQNNHDAVNVGVYGEASNSIFQQVGIMGVINSGYVAAAQPLGPNAGVMGIDNSGTGGNYAGYFKGRIAIVDSTQQNGYVLTSDSFGNAKWQLPAADSFWVSDGVGDIYNNNPSFVGIGTSFPGAQLDVQSNGSTAINAMGNLMGVSGQGLQAGIYGQNQGACDGNNGFGTVYYNAIDGNLAQGTGVWGQATNDPNSCGDSPGGVVYGVVGQANAASSFSDIANIGVYGEAQNSASQQVGIMGVINGGYTGNAQNYRWPNAAVMAIDNSGGAGNYAGYFKGRIAIVDSTYGAGKVLTSDASGNASWQTPAGGGISVWDTANGNLYTTYRGNVGIGTSSPAALLDVEGNVNMNGEVIMGDLTGLFAAGIVSPADVNMNGYVTLGDLAANIGGTQVVVDPTGKVTIGDIYLNYNNTRLFIDDEHSVVSIPRNTLVIGNVVSTSAIGTGLEVHGGFFYDDGNTHNSGAVLTNDGTGRATWQMPSGGSGPWTITGNYIYNINNGDSIGIGTPTPVATLEVNGNAQIDLGLNVLAPFTGTAITGQGGNAGIYGANGSPSGGIQITQYLYNHYNQGEGAAIWGNATGDPSSGVASYNTNLGIVGQSYANNGDAVNVGVYGEASNSLYQQVGIMGVINGTFTNGGVDSLGPNAAVMAVDNSGIAGNYAGYFQGRLAIVDGTQQNGYVLTSDANGIASWQAPGGGGSSLWAADGNDIFNANTGTVTMGDWLGTSAGAQIIVNGVGGDIRVGDPFGTTGGTQIDVNSSLNVIGIGDVFGDNNNTTIIVDDGAGKITTTGGVQITGNGAGTGKVLTSDNSGNATWQTPTVTTSGTYTPSVGVKVNVGSVSMSTAQYMRVANVVTVSGQFTLTATSTGSFTLIEFSLPVSSNITAANMVGGSCTAFNIPNGTVNAYLDGNTATSTVNFNWMAQSNFSSNQTWSYQFTYLIN